MRSDSPEPIEDTSGDKGSEEDDGKSAKPESFGYAKVRKDEESKHNADKGPVERTCQETQPR